MTNINFEVPEKIHTRFKIACIRKKVDMKDRLIELIKEDIKNE